MGAVIGYDIPPEGKQLKLKLINATLNDFGDLIVLTDEGEFIIGSATLEKKLNEHYTYEIYSVFKASKDCVIFDLLDEENMSIERQELNIINLILEQWD